MSKWVVAGGLILIGLLGYLFGFSRGKVYQEYKFLRVVDGDTLMISSLRDGKEFRLRIWGMDAPELGECLGEEAKQGLIKELNKAGPSYEIIGTDAFGRLVAKVLVAGDDIALEQVGKGLAVVDDAVKEHVRAELKPDKNYLVVLRQAEEEAKAGGLGVWSKECLAARPKRNLGCNIKGNYRSGKKEYYLPLCSSYESVVVVEKAGDKWLCSEEQARAFGYTKALSCVER